MRSKREGLLNLRDSYKLYKSKAEAPVVPIKEYLIIVSLFIKYIVKNIIDGNIVKLPERLGSMSIQGRKLKPRINEVTGKINGLTPNFKATNELWARCPDCKDKKQMIYYFNEHSQGVRYSLLWSKKTVYLENIRLYRFTWARQNRRSLPLAIAKGNEFMIEHGEKVPKKFYPKRNNTNG